MAVAAGSQKDFQIRLYNITQTETSGYVIGMTGAGTSNFVNVVLPLNIYATANDKYRMEIRCITDSSDAILKSGSLHTNYLHN